MAETFRLRDHRHRARTGLFLVEGAREVERALAAGVPPRTLLLAPDLAPRDRKSVV